MNITGKITKYDFFIQSIAAGAHLYREWMIRTFTVAVGEPVEDAADYYLYHSTSLNKVVTKVDGKWVELEGSAMYEIAFIYHEIVPLLKAKDILNAKVDIKDTTWGEMLFNARVIVYGCGDLIDYLQYPISLGKLTDYFSEHVVSNPRDGNYLDGVLYIKHYKKTSEAITDLAAFEFFVPSLDRIALTAPDNNEELKDQLFEKYKDQLGDPIVQVKIQDELVDNYKKHLKGSPSEGFLYKPKSINAAIKRMLLIHGSEAGFANVDKPVLIKNSLDQGLDITNFSIQVNSLRNGAYSRGALTALAGADVDLIGRIFQNVRILADFCGTKETFPMYVTSDHLSRWILDKGKRVLLTNDNITLYENKMADFFSPLFCGVSRMDVCSVCIGDILSKYPEALHTNVSRIPSTMMDKMMGSAHAKEQKATLLEENWLS